MSRKAKPIEILLKQKSIKPSLEFLGADKIAYEEFLAEQAEAKLLEAIKEQKQQDKKKATKKKTTKKKTTKKVKQTIDPETVTTGEEEPKNEKDNPTAEESL